MSQEKVLKTLGDFGLTTLDSKVYVYLAKSGPKKGNEISKAVKIQKQQLYRSLKKLQSKAIVSATLEHPTRFSAVSFEQVIDLFVRAKLEEAQSIQHEKGELLSSWEEIPVGAAPEVSARFTVIEGRNIIYSRIRQMINNTESQLSIISTVPGLARADQFGLLDAGFKHPFRSKVQFRILTHLTEQNVGTMKSLLNETPKPGLRFEIRNPNLGLRLFPRMVIRDEEESVFFITPKVDSSLSERDDVCLWTNCNSLVRSFLAMFEDLWRNSTVIDRKIIEIETGRPTPKTFVISDAEVVKKKYDEILQTAKDEILLMTSTKGLVELGNNTSQLSKWTRNGIAVKIMAPCVRDNFEAAEQISKFCTVKHVSLHYWETAIIDRKHLFHFKTPSSDREEDESRMSVEEAYYTDDPESVGTMKDAFNDIWSNAQTPSSVAFEQEAKPYGSPIVPLPKNIILTKMDLAVIDLKPPGTITEKDVVDKILHAQKTLAKDPLKSISRGYGSNALAVIHPPDKFNLPDMMIAAYHVDKQSSFGEEDTVIVHFWLETPMGHAYVPVAVAGDSLKGQDIWRAVYAATPAGRNIQLFKKNEIQVMVHGNTLFAGWTVPIKLFPPQYTLPPACMLIEGYGDVKTVGFTTVGPSGFKVETEQNYFDAFVTFIHPASRYSGPGTDGVLVRDFVTTNIPP